VFAALGVTRELLTGESHFSGTKITVEILNTMFLLTREVLKNYIERQLFTPICEAHGWYVEGKNGVKKYLYPNIGFNRLTIRDNAEVFDSLYQLYQKGSVPIGVIYELFNLNSDEMEEKLYRDLFTVNDATFNRLVEEVNGEAGRAIAERSNVADKIAKYLNLDMKEAEGEEEGFGGGFGEESGFGGFGEEPSGEEPSGEESAEGEGEGPTEEPSEVEDLAEQIAEALPEDATDEEINQVVEEVSSE